MPRKLRFNLPGIPQRIIQRGNNRAPCLFAEKDFRRDGVAFLLAAFDQDWIEILRQGIEENIANPSERARIWKRDAQGRTCFYDSQVWCNIEAYRNFALNPP